MTSKTMGGELLSSSRGSTLRRCSECGCARQAASPLSRLALAPCRLIVRPPPLPAPPDLLLPLAHCCTLLGGQSAEGRGHFLPS